MNTTRPQSGETAARAALQTLCAGLLAAPRALATADLLGPDEVPPPFDRLLVHRDHMTSTLAAFHGVEPRLEVLAEEQAGDTYARRIVLRLPESGPVVELGVARVHFALVPRAVRDEILARVAPLGEILIRHDVLRVIEPRWFWRFSEQPAADELLHYFGGSVGGPLYGRVGRILVHGAAAIEVLEIVRGRITE